MAENEIASPSKPKRSRPNSNKLVTDLELKQILQVDSSDEEYDCDSDSDFGWDDDSDSEDSEGGGAISTIIDQMPDVNIENIVDEQDDDLIISVSSSETNTNVISNEFWSTGPPNLRDILFIGKPGLQVPVPTEGKPIDFFYLFADDEFFNLVLLETSRYADGLQSKKTSPKSRVLAWKVL